MRQAIVIAVLLAAAGTARAQLNISPVTQSARFNVVASSAQCVDTTGQGTVTCDYGGFNVESVNLIGGAVAGRQCHCYPGNTGPTGDDGESVTGSSESPGSNCSAGGMAYELGGFTSYVCNGAAGSNGSNGSNGQSVAIAAEGAGANCSMGGSSFTVGGTTTYACNGLTGSAGATGSVGPQGPAGTGFHYLDSSDDVVPDVYWRDGQAVYWTGDAFWPVSPRTGLDAIDYFGTPLLLRYLTNACNTTPIEKNDHQNLVTLARPTSGTAGAYRPADAVTYTGQGTCWGWTSGGNCAAMGCPGQPWVEYVSAGTAPDVSGYAMPMRPVGD